MGRFGRWRWMVVERQHQLKWSLNDAVTWGHFNDAASSRVLLWGVNNSGQLVPKVFICCHVFCRCSTCRIQECVSTARGENRPVHIPEFLECARSPVLINKLSLINHSQKRPVRCIFPSFTGCVCDTRAKSRTPSFGSAFGGQTAASAASDLCSPTFCTFHQRVSSKTPHHQGPETHNRHNSYTRAQYSQ